MPRRNEIPEVIRSKVVDLHNAGIGYKLISKSLELHHSTVRKIIHKWLRFNTVATLPRSGRPTKKPPSGTQTARLEEADHAGLASDKGGEKVVQQSAGPAPLIKEDPDKKMREMKSECEDADTADYSSDSDEEDPMLRVLFPTTAKDPREDADHKRRKQSTSCDDTPEEDPMEQIFDPNFDGEKKIHAGSSLSVRTLLLLLLAFILKHDLSKSATKDLLALLNLVVPGCIPSSLQFIKRHLTDMDRKTEIHLYCPKCENYLGVEPGTKCGVCQQRVSKKSLLEKANYLLVMPLEMQLRKVFTRLHSKLGKHFTRGDNISDVNTGVEYKHEEQEGSITLTFTCDSSPPLNSSRFSVWPILCTINELPYAERCKNVLVHTLWFGKGKPLLQCFFTPFINELHKLSHEGFTWEDESGLELSTRVTAKICICDSVARSAVQNFQPFSSEFGCGFCYHKGELVQKGRGYTRVYPVQADGCDLRHMAETEQLANVVIQNGYPQGQMGVKGHSPLLLLPSFDIVKGFIPDYMHCVCLGVVPEFVSLWLDPLYARKRFHLPPQSLKDLDKALCAIQPPDEIRQRPRRLSERLHWEASEWRAFALLYSPVILRKALPKLYYKHWMLLISSLHILLSQFATQEEISCAELCLVQFISQIPSLYGLEHCSFNCHLLMHLTDSARNWGLLWANSAFVFQDVHSRLLEMYSKIQSASADVFKQFVSHDEIIRKGSDVLKDASTEITDLFSSMTSFGVFTNSSNYVREDVFTLGCGFQRSLTEGERAALQSNDTQRVNEYKRFVYRDMLVTTLDYSVSSKRNNSVIETTSGFVLVESVVVVRKPCSCEKSSSCSCRELVAFCRKLLPTNSQPTIQNTQIDRNIAEFLVRVRSSDELCAVTSRDIVAKCFVMVQKGRLHVMRMPVLNSL